MDPASAVGVASFAIDVCEKIVKYCAALKSYSSDINQTIEDAEALSQTLDLLKNSLQDGQLDKKIVSDVEHNLLQCSNAVTKLGLQAQGLSTYPKPTGVKEKLHSAGQRALYPFKQSALAEMRQSIADIHARLHMTVSVLQLDTSIDTGRIVSQINKRTTAIDSQTNATAIHVVTVNTRTADIAKDVSDLSQRTAQLNTHTTEIITHTSSTDKRVIALITQASDIHAQTSDTAARVDDVNLLAMKIDARTSETDARAATIDARTANMERRQSDAEYQRLVARLRAPDPWSNYDAALEKRNAQTGRWLLESHIYQQWKSGSVRCAWLFGKAGCGKTVLCSAVVEDMKEYCRSQAGTALAAFYFTFSDKSKQSWDGTLRSLVAQLCWEEPAYSLLQETCRRSGGELGHKDLTKLLEASFASHEMVFLMLDALDECPEEDELRDGVLNKIEEIASNVANVRIFITSREMNDIRERLESIQAQTIIAASAVVDQDIRKYISTQMLQDTRLKQMKPESKTLIEETLSKKSDGMFRWAYCQLAGLRKLKTTKPSHIRKALSELPSTLDETYLRMLTSIGPAYTDDALKLLYWLAYARRPLTLAELAEVTIIQPGSDPEVDTADRGDWRDTLNILAGLVTVTASAHIKSRLRGADPDDESCSEDELTPHSKSTIRLAHFSVLEYLESDRLRKSDAKSFSLDAATGHRILTQSCLAYIAYQGADDYQGSVEQINTVAPLSRYSVRHWVEHSRLRQDDAIGEESAFLLSKDNLIRWLILEEVYDQGSAGHHSDMIAATHADSTALALYHASRHGLAKIVRVLLRHNIDVNTQGLGSQDNALQVASFEGHCEVVRILLEHGASVDAHGGYFNALQAASAGGNADIARILIEHGADINEPRGQYGPALTVALAHRQSRIARMLVEHGANVNIPGGPWGNALQAAAPYGDDEMIQMLIKHGANVNAQGGQYGNALHAASLGGQSEIVRILLEHGADVNAQPLGSHNILMTAIERGSEEIVRMLLDCGADVNARADDGKGTALRAAMWYGNRTIAQLSIDAGAQDDKIQLPKGQDVDTWEGLLTAQQYRPQ